MYPIIKKTKYLKYVISLELYSYLNFILYNILKIYMLINE